MMTSGIENSPTYAALLRGINVGGKHKVPMSALIELFMLAGCSAIRTYIQSGNVVFNAPPGERAALAAMLMTSIEQQFGFSVAVILRVRAEIEQVLADNPWPGETVSDDQPYVVFLGDTPSAEQIATLDPQRSPPDRFVCVGAHIYLLLPNGMARTKLTNVYFDSRLRTVSTIRNWRTVRQLLTMF